MPLEVTTLNPFECPVRGTGPWLQLLPGAHEDAAHRLPFNDLRLGVNSRREVALGGPLGPASQDERFRREEM
jgi:hypothetical protein